MTLYINTKDSKVVTVNLKKDHRIIRTLVVENIYGSQVLLPLITRLLKESKVKLEEITAVNIEIGLGSFTGLRVGVSVAQALGFALNIPVNGQIGKPVDIRYT